MFHQTCGAWWLKLNDLNIKNMFLFNTATTINQAYNLSLLKNTRNVGLGIMVHCNSGSIHNNKIVYVGSIEMWANPFEITNVVSIKLLIEKYLVIFDSINCVGVFKVETTNGTVEVLLHNNRLYYLDLAHGDNAEVMFITMVGKNYEGFSKKQVEKTPEARELQGIMGHPSQKDFKGMVSNKSIHDLNITTNDSKCAPKVYGLDLVNVREKMV